MTRAINVRLRRASVMSGRILSASGEGLPGVEIELLSERDSARRRLPAAQALTDEEGIFQVGDLRPGSYYVFAHTGHINQPSGTGVDSSTSRTSCLATTCFARSTQRDALWGWRSRARG